jgi:predicted porin
MKKLALALLVAATCGLAQAQSSVTLYGNIDSSIQYLQNAGVAAGGTVPVAGTTKSTAVPAAGSCTACYVDSAVSSSIWGLKGTEDLGGGTSAIFQVESDIPTNNGGTHQDGIFRRGASLGLSSNSSGTVKFGLQTNPIQVSNATLLPVMGNSVTTVRNAIGFSGTDFIRNAVSYTTPRINGVQGQVMYGASNTVDDASAGTYFAGNVFYNQGNWDATAAFLKGNAASSTATTANTSASDIKGDRLGYLAGIKYRVTPSIQVGYAFAHAEMNAAGTATGATNFNANANMVGIGYQATPAVLLGANYIVTTADSSLTNLQARYSLSKRTTVYSQVGIAKNGAGAASDGSAYGNFAAINTQTATSPAANIAGMPGSGVGMPNTTVTAVGVGLMHSF